MQLSIQVDSNFQDRLNQLLETQLPAARQQLVEQLMQDTLALTIAGNPVRTGRSRDAWQACLAQLNGGGSDSAEGTVEQDLQGWRVRGGDRR